MSIQGGEAPLAARIFRRGIAAFKSEDYRRSIQFLDQALQALPSKANNISTLKVNILDSRAAAKEKINDLCGALADAKLVIDFAPDSPKGYMRSARLFQKIGRCPAAVNMFERAIVKLGNAEKHRETIERLQVELKQAQLSCKNAEESASAKPKRELSGFLPLEIFIAILSFLDTSSRFRCMAVCQSWRNNILNTPNLWTELSLTAPSPRYLITKTRFWLDRLGPNHRLQALAVKLSSSSLSFDYHKLFKILMDKSSLPSSLRSSRLSGVGLKSLSFHFDGTFNDTERARNVFNDVLSFVHMNRTSLVTLELQFPASSITCPVPLQAFMAQFPRLKELLIHGKRLQSLTIRLDKLFRNSVQTERSSDYHYLWEPVEVDPLDGGQPVESQLERLDLKNVTFHPSADSIKLNSLRSLSLDRAALNASNPLSLNRTALNPFNLGPGINLTCLDRLENLEICGPALHQAQWDTVWRPYDQLPILKKLRLDGFAHFLPHFLQLANVPDNWSPDVHAVEQPFSRVGTRDIFPKLESFCLSSLDSVMGYKFLAIFGHQFRHLNSLSMSGLPIDRRTEPMLIQAFRQLPALEKINLSKTNVTPAVIDAIKSDRLTHLQLTDCVSVTFSSLSRLVSHQFSLLDITGCHLISTREMIEWLANRVHSLVWQSAAKNKNSKAQKRLFLD